MSNIEEMTSEKLNIADSEQSPLLSVVMPVYNPGQYLMPCLDSVIGQTFADFELIAIDDCSTDGSAEILREYASKENRFICISNENNIGTARTRNLGLHLSRGKYIVFLDADDYFEKDYFSDAISTLEFNHADVYVSPILVHDMKTDKEKLGTKRLNRRYYEKNIVFNAKNYKGDLFQTVSVAPYNKVVKRKFVLLHELEFQVLKNCNDVFWGLMVLSLAERITYTPKAYVHYRANWPGQITAKRGKDPECIAEACKAVKGVLGKNDRWQYCYKSFNEYAVNNIITSIKASESPTDTLHLFVDNIFPELALVDLKPHDFCSSRGYGMYRLYHFGNALLGSPTDIMRCCCDMLSKGEVASTLWVVGHVLSRILGMVGIKE